MSAKERSDIFRSLFLSKRLARNKISSKFADTTNIPRFELVEKLGQGGMASVFLAEQQSTGRQVAIKIMAQHLRADSRWAERFLDEAKRLADLSHPNIVPVFDWGTHEGTGYIIMEYMKGGDLNHKVETSRLLVRDVIQIVSQIASGLDFAGEKGYVHRDIKPANILFREDGSPCILDFGISKDSSANTTISSQGIPIGTGAFMSPEQAVPGDQGIDHRSDLYSLGIVLYELLAAKKPFEYAQYDPLQAFQLYLFAHVNSQPPPLPPQFKAFQPIIDKLLAKNPDHRFVRGNELRKALLILEMSLPAALLDLPIRGLEEPTIVQPLSKQALKPSEVPGKSTSESLSPDDFPTPPLPSQAKDSNVRQKSRLWFHIPAMVAGITALGFIGYPYYKMYTAKPDAPLQHYSSKPPVKADSAQPKVTRSPSKAKPVAKNPQQVKTKQKPSPDAVLLNQLLAKARIYDVNDTQNLASQRQLISLYHQILEHVPKQTTAIAGLQTIRTRQAVYANQLIHQQHFKKIPEIISLLDSISARAGKEIEQDYKNALAAFKAAQEKKLKLARLQSKIQNDLQSAGAPSKSSRDRLTHIASLIQDANRLGLDRNQSEIYRKKLSKRYETSISEQLRNGDLRKAKRWIQSGAKAGVKPKITNRLNRQLATLEKTRELERQAAQKRLEKARLKRIKTQEVLEKEKEKEKGKGKGKVDEPKSNVKLKHPTNLAQEKQHTLTKSDNSVESNKITPESSEIKQKPKSKSTENPNIPVFGSF